ncbi:MAG TPA: tetratricopeptide repeat protein [Planctomycetes bacterium]|nr:tetratricopeptide repeat protein [Planctomycetota bacterium]
MNFSVLASQKPRWLQIIVAGVIAAATLGVYWQVRGHELVNFDDPKYVTENPIVQKGLTIEGAKWAFTTRHASNWFPLTWLSLMLDCEISDDWAGMCHTTNLLLHVANALLLFYFLIRTTGLLWPAAFASALFALHPLHVESVAWVTERKDVLSTFFWLMTMLAYARYARRPTISRYAIVLILFAFGLMSKPMLVTLPFVLLLLDYWPLGRLPFSMPHKRLQKPSRASGRKGRAKKDKHKEQTSLILILEKVPLFIMSAASCIVTLWVQRGVEVPARVLSIHSRLSNAMISYVVYLYKMVWPVRLAAFYPHAKTWPALQVAGAGLLLLMVTTLMIQSYRKGYTIVGWLWYLGTLVPVIGLVQVGVQSYADRYTYVPLIGIFIVIAWTAADFVKDRVYRKIAVSVLATVILAALGVCTQIQAGYWRNNVALYEHALKVTADNHVAHNNLGVVLREQGKTAEALKHFEAAVKVFPMYIDAVVNLAAGLLGEGRGQEAIFYCEAFLQKGRGNCLLHNNYANALKAAGRIDEAIRQYYKALEFDKNAWQVHCNLGMIMAARGKIDKALKHFQAAAKVNPNHPAVRKGLEELLKIQRQSNQKN